MYKRQGSIGDQVFFDTDGDGVQDGDEDGIEGVMVVLTLPDGSMDTTFTDMNGIYIFEDLPAGDYTVTVGAGPEGTGLTTAGTDDVMLGVGEMYEDADFGFNDPTSSGLGDTVWFDEDGNGLQDPTEPGIENVLVILSDGMSNPIDSMITDMDGFYYFSDLEPGGYILTYVPLDTMPGLVPVFTCADKGGDEGVDSDADSLGTTGIIILPPNTQDSTIDAGIELREFDLALIKELDASVTQPVRIGDPIIYNLTVINEGEVDAFDVQVKDFIPEGLILMDSDWTDNGGVATLNTPIPSITLAEGSQMVSITFELDPNYTGGQILNNAEISFASLVSGSNVPFLDVDSTPDSEDPNSPADTTDVSDDFDFETVCIIVETCAVNEIVPSCMTQAEVDAAFAMWLNGFGGEDPACDVFGRFVEAPVAPDACGGEVTVTFQLTDSLESLVFFECSATFSVEFDTEAPVCPASWTTSFASNGINCVAPGYDLSLIHI